MQTVQIKAFELDADIIATKCKQVHIVEEVLRPPTQVLTKLYICYSMQALCLSVF